MFIHSNPDESPQYCDESGKVDIKGYSLWFIEYFGMKNIK